MSSFVWRWLVMISTRWKRLSVAMIEATKVLCHAVLDECKIELATGKLRCIDSVLLQVKLKPRDNYNSFSFYRTRLSPLTISNHVSGQLGLRKLFIWSTMTFSNSSTCWSELSCWASCVSIKETFSKRTFMCCMYRNFTHCLLKLFVWIGTGWKIWYR